MLDEQEVAALALTSSLVDSAAKPLSFQEFWELCGKTEPSALRGKTADSITSELEVPGDYAERIARLFDRGAGLALAIEKLDHSGIWTITGVGERYPERLRLRLGNAAPVVLHGVGDPSLLETEGLGVVGSRDISSEGSDVAREIAHIAARSGLPVVSGAARGVDRDAMNGAFEAGGQVVGVVADPLVRAVARPNTRHGVAKGQICLVTPYTPAAPFSVANAEARNKIIYGLSRCTIVVAADHETGGTWAGATEALTNHYGRVASWTGAGSGAGNSALIKRGAVEFSDVTRLDQLLHESVIPLPANDEAFGDQLTLGF